MKKIVSLLALFASFFIYNSCSPISDTNGDLLVGIDNTNNYGKTLKKVSGKDKTGLDISIHYTYTNNQLTKVNFEGLQDFDISYTNGVITKIFANTYVGGLTSTTYNLVYTGGLLTEINEEQELAPGVLQKSTSFITYTNGKVSSIRRSIFDDQPQPEEISYILSDFEYNGNNVSKYTSTTGMSASPIPPIAVVVEYSDFDIKNNPFNKLPKEFNMATLSTFNSSFAAKGFSVNNPGEQSMENNISSINYIYNKDGFPITINVDGETSTYEYY